MGSKNLWVMDRVCNLDDVCKVKNKRFVDIWCPQTAYLCPKHWWLQIKA